MPLLIGRERPDVIFFPGQCPETYSYTLSYALATGLPIVAPRLGALGERLTGYPRAWLVDWDLPVAECNDLFVSLLGRGSAGPPTVAAAAAHAASVPAPSDHLENMPLEDAGHDP